MLIGYMRVSKADGSQVTDLQLDVLSRGRGRLGAYLRGSWLRRQRRPSCASWCPRRCALAIPWWSETDRLGRNSASGHHRCLHQADIGLSAERAGPALPPRLPASSSASSLAFSNEPNNLNDPHAASAGQGGRLFL